MSDSAHHISCSHCDYRSPVSPLHTLFAGKRLVYDLDNRKLAPILSITAWCRTCAALTPVEYLPTVADVEHKVARYRERLAKISNVNDRAFATIVVASAAEWAAWATSRAGSRPRCLCCGGVEVERVSIDPRTGMVVDGAVHTACGGKLRVPSEARIVPEPVNAMIKYGRDGLRLAQAEVTLPKPATPAVRAPEPAPAPVQGQETSLHQNPFWQLGASVHDSRQRIVELVDEHALTLDDAVSRAARTALTNPRNRLAAELAWFPGVAPERAAWIATQARDNPSKLMQERDLPPLAQVNLLASAMEKLSANTSVGALSGLIGRFCELIDGVDAQATLDMINADREQAGFPPVAEVGLVEEGLRERIQLYSGAQKALLNKLPTNKLVELMTALVKEGTQDGRQPPPAQLAALADAYDIEAQMFLQGEADNINKLLEATLPLGRAGGDVLARMIESVEMLVRNWCRVAYPAQLALVARGLDHPPSRNLAMAVRETAVALYNKHSAEAEARRLTGFLQRTFAHMPTLADKMVQDIEAIGSIDQQRQSQDEQWRTSIAKEVKVGFRKLQIDGKEIRFAGKAFALDSITHLRWSGVRRSINGIPTGTTFTFVWGDGKRQQTVTVSGQNSFKVVADALWPALGHRLMLDLAANVGMGSKFQFGRATVADDGVQLVRHRLLQRGVPVFVKWPDVHITKGPGFYTIRSRKDKNVYVQLDYSRTPNGQVLEQAVTLVVDNKLARMSALVG